MERRNLFKGLGAFLASAFAWTGLVKSQHHPPTARIGVINTVSDGNHRFPSPAHEVHEVSVPIKNFDPGEAEEHIYQVVEIRERGGGGGSARPDENGILTIYRAKKPSTAPWAPQYYYYSVNRTSGDRRYTFELTDVPLTDLVRSLQLSMRVRGQPLPRGWPMIPPSTDTFIPTVSLTAENATLQETLELLRQASGCDVVQVENRLVIDWRG